MLRSEKQKAAGSKQKPEGSRQKEMQKRAGIGDSARGVGNSCRAAFCLLLSAYCLLAAVGCRHDMQDQPKMKPYRSSTFFRDGQSSRQLVEGTVPRGFLKLDTEFFTGKKAGRANAGMQ